MIQLYHVYKAYGGEDYALHDVTLNADKGDFLFVTGPSGAGKTTLLNLIICAEQVTRGQILVDGINLQRLNRSMIPYFRRKIGVVFQDFKLLGERTVFANVGLALEVLGKSRAYIDKKVRQVLRLVGLDGKETHLSFRLSGCYAAWDSRAVLAIGRLSCRAASSSEWPSPGPWLRTPFSFLPMSPRVIWTTKLLWRSWNYSGRLTDVELRWW